MTLPHVEEMLARNGYRWKERGVFSKPYNLRLNIIFINASGEAGEMKVVVYLRGRLPATVTGYITFTSMKDTEEAASEFDKRIRKIFEDGN